jgi:hypothetical protein
VLIFCLIWAFAHLEWLVIEEYGAIVDHNFQGEVKEIQRKNWLLFHSSTTLIT